MDLGINWWHIFSLNRLNVQSSCRVGNRMISKSIFVEKEIISSQIYANGIQFSLYFLVVCLRVFKLLFI